MNKLGKILCGVALGGMEGLSSFTTAFAAENPPKSPKKVEIKHKSTQKKKETVRSDNTDIFVFF